VKSIRHQLLLALLSTLTVALLLGAFATYRTARNEADTIFDYHLRQLALSLRDQALENTAPPAFEAESETRDFAIQVWSEDGIRLYFSHPRDVLPDQARLGFATIDTDHGRWRVFGIQQRGHTIQVAQPMRVRDQLALTAALGTVAPYLLLLPALGIVIWVVVGRGLSPLNSVAQAVATRSATALDPLPEHAVPSEAMPLVRSLNDLLVRLRSALDAQRAFIADAAHELRTPLTALQLQVQLSERATNETERADALAELKRGLQRATHSVQQLLTLARQEPGAVERTAAPVSLAELAGIVVGEHVALAEAKGIDLGIEAAREDAVVEGDAEGLRILLANLVSNAIRYTPAGGKVDVSVGQDDQGPFLEVCDSGPGIPISDRERVFDRFYRRSGENEEGSGLGLAIVQTIAARHGAAVSLEDADPGGLRVHVRFRARCS